MQTAITPKPARSPWLTFWPAWVLANVVGWGLVFVDRLMPYLQLSGLLSIAFVISLLQWLCLRSFLDADYIWLPVSMATYGGYLWAIILGVSSSHSFISLPALLLVGTVVLFILSWLQRFALNSFVDGATTWVIVSPLAGGFAFGAAWVVINLPGFGSPLLFWVFFGAVYGGLTGAHLILLEATTKPTSSTDDSIPPWKRTEG